MATWTFVFPNRTDGVILLGNYDINMKPITEAGTTIPDNYSIYYCCYTSDTDFTVNSNSVIIQNDDNGFEEDGGGDVQVRDWKPNSAQLSKIAKLPDIKKYRYYFNLILGTASANHIIVTLNPDITAKQPTPPTPPQPVEKKYNLLDSVPAGYDVKGDYDWGEAGNVRSLGGEKEFT